MALVRVPIIMHLPHTHCLSQPYPISHIFWLLWCISSSRSCSLISSIPELWNNSHLICFTLYEVPLVWGALPDNLGLSTPFTSHLEKKCMAYTFHRMWLLWGFWRILCPSRHEPLSNIPWLFTWLVKGVSKFLNCRRNNFHLTFDTLHGWCGVWVQITSIFPHCLCHTSENGFFVGKCHL